MRICITGGPKTGKTTLANKIADEYGDHTGTTVGHTDDLIATHEWSSASEEVSHWLDAPGPWIIEGVAVSRALRKWRDAHPGQRPTIDRLIILSHPWESLSKGQDTMAKGVATVQADIDPWLREHRISIERHHGNGFAIETGRGPYKIVKVVSDE